MSLATTGGIGGGMGGAGAGGITLAHQANAVGIPPGVPNQQHTTANASSSGPAPPSSAAAALGADLIDKNQTGLSMKQVRNKQHLPIVAIDLYAADGKAPVAYFPKKPEDPTKGAPPVYATTVSTNVTFLAENETAHKTLKKYLSNSKTFTSLQEESLASDKSSIPLSKNKKGKTPSSDNSQNNLVLQKPHQWLGLRRLQDAPEFIRARAGVGNTPTNDDNSSKATGSSFAHVIAEESSTGVGITIENSTLDGVSYPKLDDFDRVVAKVRLHESKKAISILPEEAVQIVFHTAQCAVADKVRELNSGIPSKKSKKGSKDTADDELNDDEIVDYPLAIALPAWSIHDASVEALMDASEGTGVIIPRSVAAAAGALLPSLDGNVTPILTRINIVRTALQKQHQRELVENPDAVFDDSVILLFYGMTDSGFECTGIEVSAANMTNISCIFSNFKVLSNISYQSDEPIQSMAKCSKDLESAIETIAPESDGPSAIIFYGSSEEQEQMKATWESIKSEQEEWNKVPTFITSPDTVARGTAVMGAIAHGRLTKQVTTVNSSGKKKVKPRLGIQVQHVALTAVGVSFNYHGDDKENADKKWTPIKTIFDFDRQTPAGPHSFDLNAAQCAVYKELGADAAEELSDEAFLKATAKYEGSKGIPAREDAALNLRIQVYEKWTRDGEWKKVGDPMEPLVMITTDSNSKNNTETRTACEAVILELSLAVTGLITTSLVGERTSVVVATKEARNSKIRWYLGIIFLILFCGGFLFKSWYDDFVLERDTKRLLAFYHNVVPGSIQDGDVHNARYTCYKFRNKKAKLWAKLEKKYGVPVLEAHEYEAMKDSTEESESSEESTLDLDEDEAPKEEQEL